MTSTAAPAGTRSGGFRHEAFLYRGEEEFLAGTERFVRDAVRAGEPVLLAISAGKAEQVTDRLGGVPDGVLFADMAGLGRNPARIIPAWRDFLTAHVAGGDVRARGVGEPIWAGRGPAEISEAQRHEALLNHAFGGGPGWWLLCPYDVDGLDADVVAEACRSHPFVLEDGVHRAGAPPDRDEGMPSRLDGPLPEPGADALRYPFAEGDLSPVRRVVSARATDAGLAPLRAEMLVLAVNELVTNSLQHGGGRGELLLWQEGPDVVVEVRDRGHLRDLLVGRSTPDQRQGSGRGVWLVNQVCDLVQLRSGPDRTVVRVRMGPQ